MEEMKQAGIGAIMHDGWSQAGTHFAGLIVTYMKEFPSFESAKNDHKRIVKRKCNIVFLSVSYQMLNKFQHLYVNL